MARLVIEKPRAKVERLEFGRQKRERAALEASKSRADKLFDFAEEAPEDRVSFGTKSHRLMFPLYVPDHRFGQAVMPPGLENPGIGPARYDTEDQTSLLHGLESHVETSKGTVMGGRTADRFDKNKASYLEAPAPCEHVSQKDWSSKTAYKPFHSGVASSARFPGVIPKSRQTPGAGHYEHDVERDRRPLYHHTFGGPRVLKVEAERLLPTAGPSQRNMTHQPYIRHGYSYRPDVLEAYRGSYLQAFYGEHLEENQDVLTLLEGQRAPIQLRKKAYLSRYFDDAPPPGRTQALKRAE
ncbi:uncharacterized protein LOC135824537 [Sycon ciliatum]|uniref:uncharacterized protein LOC135824537 n=1 Tax=Sycon ciliatum TaxID=27933 RepID=UPI0031F641E8|eukprot:scpid64098/ scgid12035/ 